MLVCQKCNIEYEEEKKFCRKCGSFLLSEEGSTFELPIGGSFEEGKTRENLFCPKCQNIMNWENIVENVALYWFRESHLWNLMLNSLENIPSNDWQKNG
jgi:hypothetical protein